MTSVMIAFTDAWLTDVANPSVSVHASFSGRGRDSAKNGRFAERAGGRVVVVTSVDRTRTFPLTLLWLTDAQANLLESWQGRVILLRDSAGRRVFGSFLMQSEVDYSDAGGAMHDVTLTFREITYSEVI